MLRRLTHRDALRRLLPTLLALALAIGLVAGCQAAAPTPVPPSPTPKPAAPQPAQQPAQGGALVPRKYSAPPPLTVDQNRTYTATIRTSLGDMQAELFVKDAPRTVNNFVFLAREGFYDGVRFHRIIKGFMVQTGDPTGTGGGGPGYRFDDEPVTREYQRGTLAMANAGRNTNGSQFFIVHADYPLTKNYTIFGQVTGQKDLEVLDKIASTPVRAGPTGEVSVPTQEVRITGIEVTER